MFYILDYFLIFSFSGVWHACLGLGRNLSDGPILFVHHHDDDAVQTKYTISSGVSSSCLLWRLQSMMINDHSYMCVFDSLLSWSTIISAHVLLLPKIDMMQKC